MSEPSSQSESSNPVTPSIGAYRFKTSMGELDLMPDGSVFDPVTRSLMVADVHVGKAEIFRRLGVPVPAMTSSQTLDRLSASITACDPDSLIVLGDLIHGRLPATHSVFDLLAAWREQHRGVSVSLLRGNHDHQAGDPPLRCGIKIWPAGQMLGNWQLCHEPDEALPGKGIAICGHVHPVIHLRSAHDAVRVRCFWAQANLLVVPAFGVFTGGHAISPSDTDQVFVLDGQSVRAMPTGKGRRRRARSGNGHAKQNTPNRSL